MWKGLVTGALGIAVVPIAAHADVWVGAEAPLAVATSEGQHGIFRPGFLPSGSVYVGHRALAVGLRVRGGFLREGAAPGSGREDPSTGGLLSVTAAVRMRIAGPWIEAAGGGGLTGTTLAPTVELAAGWSFTGDGYELGPSARYVRLISTDSMDSFGSAEMALVGLDVRFGNTPRRAIVRTTPRIAVVVPRVEPAPAIVQVAIDADGDRIVEREASCVHELAGCPLPTGMTILEDRIILDERVLFDLNRARVRSKGRGLVRVIVGLWRANPEWTRITIEGHADVRGSDDFNSELSERRAQRVRALMLELGSTAAQLEAVGLGRGRPRDTGHTEAAHARNRRVEFVIDRRKAL